MLLAELRSQDSVGHEHGDGQRTDPTRNGRHGTGDLRDFGMDVANENRTLAVEERPTRMLIVKHRSRNGGVRDDIDANVDDRGARLYE